jgi:hypothetical protein
VRSALRFFPLEQIANIAIEILAQRVQLFEGDALDRVVGHSHDRADRHLAVALDLAQADGASFALGFCGQQHPHVASDSFHGFMIYII